MIDIGQMVRSANPVPTDPALTDDDLDSLLHLIDTRSENMVVKERLTPVKPPAPKRAPWLVAAAAFVVVLVIGVAATLLTLPGGDDGAPATPAETTVPTTAAPETEGAMAPPFATPENAIAAYLDNVNGSGDYAAYQAMFTTDARNGHLDLAGVEDELKLQQRYEAFAAEGLQMELVACPESEGSSVVLCDVIKRAGMGVAWQVEPFSIRIRLELSPDGLIERLNLTNPAFSTEREVAFLSWLQDNDPQLQEEFFIQLYGEAPLVRPVADVVADVLGVDQEYVSQSGPITYDTTAPSVDTDAALAAVSAHIAGFADAVNTGQAGGDIVSRYFPSEDALGCGPVVDESACDSPAHWGGPMTYAFLDEWFDHLVAIDTVYEVEACQVIDTYGTVKCALRSTSPYEPFHPDHRLEEFSLRFDGDSIDYAFLDEVDIFEWRFAEVEFESWLRNNHPDIAELMYTVAGSNGFPAPKITSGSEVFSENLIEYVPLWRAATGGA